MHPLSYNLPFSTDTASSIIKFAWETQSVCYLGNQFAWWKYHNIECFCFGLSECNAETCTINIACWWLVLVECHQLRVKYDLFPLLIWNSKISNLNSNLKTIISLGMYSVVDQWTMVENDRVCALPHIREFFNHCVKQIELWLFFASSCRASTFQSSFLLSHQNYSGERVAQKWEREKKK